MFKTFLQFLAVKTITESVFNEMPETTKLELQKEYSTGLMADFEKAINNLSDQHKNEIEALKASISESGDLDAVKSLAQNLEKEIEALKETGKNPQAEEPKTLKGRLFSAFEAKADALKAAATTKQNEPFRLTIKAPVTMGLDNSVYAAGSDSSVSVTRETGIISAIRKRLMKYLTGGVSVGSLVGDNKVMWMEELDEQGTPIFIGEGDDKTEISVRYEERDKRARKIGVHGKVTTEMMRNLPSLVNYIQNNMTRRVDIVTEDQLFNGDDAGDNLAGLIPYATAFTGGGLTTTEPTFFDVIRAVALQVEIANGEASAIFIKPAIMAEMDVEKGTDGHYVLPPFKSPSGNEVAGVRLIPSNALNSLTEDFVGGDLSVVNVLFSDELSIQIGMDGNDFTKNKKTILVEQELVQFVSANDTQVLVKGDMDTAITTITAT